MNAKKISRSIVVSAAITLALASSANVTLSANDARADSGGGRSRTQMLTPGGKVLLAYTLKEVGKAEVPFCWKRSTTRQTSALTCAPGEEQTAGPLGQCYPACRSGYVGWHTVCKQPCPSGFRDDGLTCFRDAHIYGNRCRGGCDEGYHNDGCTCRRDAKAITPDRYDRGAGHAVNSCPSGMRKEGAICYADCPSGYSPTSSVDVICWQSCPSAQPKACGAGCATSNAACASNVADMVRAPLEVAANIAMLVGTGGAANAAKSAAKTAVKSGARAAAEAAVKAAIQTIKDTVIRKVRTRVEARLVRKLAREQAEDVMQAAAESLAVSALAQDFDLKQFLTDLDPSGIAATVDAFNKPQCDPDEDPPDVSWESGNAMTSGPTAVFAGKDADRAGSGDWAPGAYKATCSSNESVVGLSSTTDGLFTHAAFCANFALRSAQTHVLGAGGERRMGSRNGDWDPNYFKIECPNDQFVSGVAQLPRFGFLHSVRCSSGAGSTSGCETRVIDRGAGYSGAHGDWDPFHYKADCPAGKVAVGVSQSPATMKAHAILCCNR